MTTFTNKPGSQEPTSFLNAITPFWVVLSLAMTLIAMFHSPSSEVQQLMSVFGAGPWLMAVLSFVVSVSLLIRQIRANAVPRLAYVFLAMAILFSLMVGGMVLARLALPLIQNGLVMLLPAAGLMLAPAAYRRTVRRRS